MKKFLILLILFIITPVYAAQIVNVEYIHNAIANRWDITIPYNPALTNPRVAANMKYLLSAIDVANEMLNGEPTTYGSGEYATTIAADTVATNTAVDTLVKKTEKYVFQLEHYYEKEGWAGLIRNPEHLLMISAAGTFYIDWGDGIEEVITKDTVGEQWFGHNYETDGVYSVRIGGRATMYSQEEDLSTVILSGDPDCLTVLGGFGDVVDCPFVLESISGCLGCVFSTLSDGSQPRFINTFEVGYFINSIPENLFAGISGPPASSMFASTFEYCTGLTGPSARINWQYLYEIWPSAIVNDVGGMYYRDTGLSDYANIPSTWK